MAEHAPTTEQEPERRDTHAASGDEVRWERHRELVTTPLHSLAALATAWASYQAARWHGEQAKSVSRANAARIESARGSGLAGRQLLIDITTFTQWVDAYVEGDSELADFYRRRVREEFEPALEAWIATRPFEDPGAPETPFTMSEYRLAAGEEAARRDREAAMHSAQASVDIDRADRYVMCTSCASSSSARRSSSAA